MFTLYVDGDGCPVKEEAFKVAGRYGWRVFLVCNKAQRIPRASWLEIVVVGEGFDAADDWIAERAAAGDIVVTGDLLLANRCLVNLARVVDPRGRELDADNIGEALANRELMYQLRQMGALDTGPSGQRPRHRSNFLAKLDEMINGVKKQHGGSGTR